MRCSLVEAFFNRYIDWRCCCFVLRVVVKYLVSRTYYVPTSLMRTKLEPHNNSFANKTVEAQKPFATDE